MFANLSVLETAFYETKPKFKAKCPKLFMAAYFVLHKILLPDAIGDRSLFESAQNYYATLSVDDIDILRHLLDHCQTNSKTHNDFSVFSCFVFRHF